ncbi:MAG: hypothetical protein K8R36_04775 [Planctomycetales bacterium]|nr:hypothetical protein [Planctomycetales bacterium]
MSFWAIEYDLDADAMKEAGYSATDAARFRDAVERCFAEHCFTKLDGASLHASDRNDALSNAYSACLALTAIAGSERFISRLKLFRINDLTDLLPFVRSAKPSTSSQADGTDIETRVSRGIESHDSSGESPDVFTLKAVIQDLFLDGPEHGPKRPHAPVCKPSAKTS